MKLIIGLCAAVLLPSCAPLPRESYESQITVLGVGRSAVELDLGGPGRTRQFCTIVFDVVIEAEKTEGVRRHVNCTAKDAEALVTLVDRTFYCTGDVPGILGPGAPVPGATMLAGFLALPRARNCSESRRTPV